MLMSLLASGLELQQLPGTQACVELGQEVL
jgi:hypothetical protein